MNRRLFLPFIRTVCSCFSFKKYIVFVYVCIYARRRWECIGLKSDLNLIQNRRPFLPHFRCRFQSRHPSFRRWVERGNHQRIRGNPPSRKWKGSFTHSILCFILLNFLYIEPILKGPYCFILFYITKIKRNSIAHWGSFGNAKLMIQTTINILRAIRTTMRLESYMMH